MCFATAMDAADSTAGLSLVVVEMVVVPKKANSTFNIFSNTTDIITGIPSLND